MKSIRVLLVEDNESDAALVRAHLARPGLTVRIAEAPTLAEAIKALPTFRPHVVLLDLTLPNGRGKYTIETMREAAAGVPIVVLTGSEEEHLKGIAALASATWLGKNRATQRTIISAIHDAARLMQGRMACARTSMDLRDQIAATEEATREIAESIHSALLPAEDLDQLDRVIERARHRIEGRHV